MNTLHLVTLSPPHLVIFSPRVPVSPRPRVFSFTVRQYQVIVRGPFGEQRIVCREDQSILDAGLRAGLDLPNSCCQGWCLTCAARLISGQVEHPHARRYYPQDAAAGYILPCTAEPRSDCVIETRQQAAMKQFRREHDLPAPGG